jgi:hypothetical protein
VHDELENKRNEAAAVPFRHLSAVNEENQGKNLSQGCRCFSLIRAERAPVAHESDLHRFPQPEDKFWDSTALAHDRFLSGSFQFIIRQQRSTINYKH